jgi:hypothetical protein
LHAVADRQSEIAGARFDKRSEASLRGWETRRNRSGANGQAANLRQAQRDIMPKVKESAPSEPRMSTDPDVLARAEAARENSRELLEQMNHMSTPSQEVNTDTSVEEADEEAPQEPSVEEEQGEEAEAEERAEQSRRGIFSTIRGWGSRLNDRIRQMDIGMRFGGGRGGNGGEGNEGGEDGERNTSNRRKLLVAAVAVVGLGASIYALARWGTDGGIDVDYPRPEGLTDGEYQNRYLPGSTEGQATFWPERLLDKPNRLARFQEQYADYLRRVAGRG